MRIALFLCVLVGISCVTAQQATVQSQLSTNQTINLLWQCNYPYATATDDQGVVYSSCTGNNGSLGILWTYRDNQGQTQTGWVTSPGNGSCYQSWGLSVSHDGSYVFATCYGNSPDMQIIGYERQMNGSTWYYNPQPLNISNWTCGRDIIFDDMTEDIYAICGMTLTSPTSIIRFPHNSTTDSYMMAQDLGIPANYMKLNALNKYLYWATTTNLGYLVIHNDDGSAVSMPNNMTMIPVNGVLTNYCEITSFTFSHNTTTTLFVGCTGVHNLLQSYSSYSILRIDMNATWSTMTTTITNNSTMNNNSTNNSTNNSSMNSNTTTTTSVLTWTLTAMNITWTDSKAQGADGIQDLSYPADGSCKGPGDMEVDSMNQLYVACTQNPDVRSVIRYTQMNSTYYLPAYVTSPSQCSHPGSNSLTLTQQDAVIVSCYVSNLGLEFVAMNQISSSSSSSSSSSTGGFNGSTMSSSSGSSSLSGGTPIPGFNGTVSSSSSSSTGGFNFNGTRSSSSSPSFSFSSSSSSSSPVVCVNGVCSSTGSSTGIVNSASSRAVDVTVFFVSALLLVLCAGW